MAHPANTNHASVLIPLTTTGLPEASPNFLTSPAHAVYNIYKYPRVDNTPYITLCVVAPSAAVPSAFNGTNASPM